MADAPTTNSPSTVFRADNSICADQSKQGTELSAAISQLESRIQSTLDLNREAVDEIQEWKASRNYPEDVSTELAKGIARHDIDLVAMRDILEEDRVTMEDVDTVNRRSVIERRHPHASFWALVRRQF